MDTNKFLMYCYNFPYNVRDEMRDRYGESLGDHFITKWEKYTKQYGNNFIGLIYTYMGMTDSNRETFNQMVEDYYNEI